ncbi:MAG: hypothetical protein O7E52_07505, partial [Candidatus Poribacteria bacterium]|nr:hypothetical protein [Candidatus Poribacteria bacterium]
MTLLRMQLSFVTSRIFLPILGIVWLLFQSASLAYASTSVILEDIVAVIEGKSDSVGVQLVTSPYTSDPLPFLL